MRAIFKPSPLKRVIFFVLFDTIIFFVSFFLAYQLRFNFDIWPEHWIGFWNLVWYLIFIKIVSLFLLKAYYIRWRFFVLSDVRKILLALIFSYAIFFLYLVTFYDGVFPRSVLFIDFFISIVLIVIFRFLKRFILDMTKPNSINPTIIIGANAKAVNFITSFHAKELNYDPVAIVDDDKDAIGTYISDIKVHDIKELYYLIDKYSINSAIIAKDYTPKELDKLFEELQELNVKNIKLAKLLGDKHERLQNISIEDLLARRPKDLDKKAVESFIKDKIILITGAGGSIGSEIAKQCAKYGAKRLILLDHSEFNLYKISESLKKYNPVSLMQSVIDIKLLQKSFSRYKPQIVIHAAAYKHVHLCEENVEGAILNNIIGTKNCIDLAIRYHVDKFVLISTDKAVRPTSVMGATKRVSELYAHNVDSKNTLITTVRFGNVLGSSGSVIPKFKYQIENNIPLTVTHPEVTRYFMLIPEACQLVLQAASIAKKNELFILDMGEPIRIVDLARKMLRLYGKSSLGVEFVGLKKGEKLYEELLIDENDKKSIYDSIFITTPTFYDIDKLNQDIEELLSCDDKIKKLKEIIPEFKHNS